MFARMDENNAQLIQCRQVAIKPKEHALSVFHRVESKYVAIEYSYLVTIAKTKTTLFCLAMRYVFYMISFGMASKLIDYTYDVSDYLALHVCSRHKISSFVCVIHATKLQNCQSSLMFVGIFIST